jgi:hypothetical protein
MTGKGYFGVVHCDQKGRLKGKGEVVSGQPGRLRANRIPSGRGDMPSLAASPAYAVVRFPPGQTQAGAAPLAPGELYPRRPAGLRRTGSPPSDRSALPQQPEQRRQDA